MHRKANAEAHANESDGRFCVKLSAVKHKTGLALVSRAAPCYDLLATHVAKRYNSGFAQGEKSCPQQASDSTKHS